MRVLSLLVGAVVAAEAGAQRASLVPPPYAEYRADVIAGRGTAAQVGGGVTVPMGLYVRLGLIGAVGATRHDGATRASGRSDAIARFVLDPFHELPVALSLGGGVSVPYEANRRIRPYLTAVVDLEGRRRGGVTPALQVGLGGGTRVGIALRRSPPQRR